MSPTRAEGVRYFSNPYLLGGDADLRLAILADTHLNQVDTSQNVRLWDVFPVDASGQEGLQDPGRVAHLGHAVHNLGELKKALMEEEAAQIVSKVRALRIACNLGSAVPWNSAFGRKRAGEVLPLKNVMEQVMKKKEVVNQLYTSGAYRAAVQGYAACLLDLMPWYATPLFFTAQQAFDSGLAMLESSLWNNLYISVLKASLLPWIKIELRLLAFEAVNDMRYVPIKTLHKARCRYVVQHGEDHGEEEASGAMVNMTNVFRECTEEMVNKNSDDWAHRHCIGLHKCLSPELHAKAAVWTFEEDWQIRPAIANPLDLLE